MNKKGDSMAEGTIFIIRLVLIVFIAFIVLGISNLLYGVYIDVRNTEAVIMSRSVADCLSPEGVLNLDSLAEEDYFNLLAYCKIYQSDRFYIGVRLADVNNVSVAKLSQGDSSQIWALKILGNKYSNSLKKYTPGYYSLEYPTYFIKDGSKQKGIVKMEVLVNNEF
jgi:hypothetical protein